MTEITAADFDTKVLSSKKCLIHFWAVWNGYDGEQNQLLQELENEFEEVNFYTMEVDRKENHQICSDHGVQGSPTIVIYMNGIKKDTRIGLLQPDQLKEMLRNA